MSLKRYWDYATSTNKKGNTIYHGPLDRMLPETGGVQSSGHHYGILSGAWDQKAYYESAEDYDHISMYDASQDATGTHHYGKRGGYDGRIKNATKDVIGYDPTIGANATLSRGKSYFTKWISEGEYKDQDTTGRTLQTYRAGKRSKNKYDRVGGAVEVINFDQYMNDVGYAEAAQAMGIDKYTTLEQIHNAMRYMQGTWQPPAAEEEEDVVVDEDYEFEKIDGTIGGGSTPIEGDNDGDGLVDPILGVTDEDNVTDQGEDTFDYQTAYDELQGQLTGVQEGYATDLANALTSQQTEFDSLLEEALANQNTDYQTQLANALSGARDSYATDLANALATQQTGFDTAFANQQAGFDTALANQQAGFDMQLSSMNSMMSNYQSQMRMMNEEALRAQEQMRIQAAYGDPGRVTGATVAGVSEADDEDELITLGATGSFGRDGLRISSLNI